MEELLERHGPLAYDYEMSKDLLHTRIVTIYPNVHVFELNLKTKIRPYLIKGFPPDKQELINGTAKEARESGRETERLNAMAKSNRIIRDIKRHTYVGYDNDTDEEENADNSVISESGSSEQCNLPVAEGSVQNEMSNVVTAVSAIRIP